MFSVCGVDNGCATNFSYFLPIAIEHPASDLTRSNHIFDEQYTAGESQRQLVKQLNILQQVVIACVGVAVLIVMAIDEQFNDWLGACADEIRLL